MVHLLYTYLFQLLAYTAIPTDQPESTCLRMMYIALQGKESDGKYRRERVTAVDQAISIQAKMNYQRNIWSLTMMAKSETVRGVSGT